LIEEKTDLLIKQLKQGHIDAALLALPVHENFLRAELLFTDEFKLAVAPDNPLASKHVISQADLYQQQLLLLDEGHCLRGQAMQVCRLNGAEEQQDVRATGLETLRQMVKAGTGITLIPQIAIPESDPGICYLPFTNPPSRSIGLLWRKTSARIQLINTLIEIIKHQAET
jgi:LysR family hydrogen peroxide-inducible transcriptional activator